MKAKPNPSAIVAVIQDPLAALSDHGQITLLFDNHSVDGNVILTLSSAANDLLLQLQVKRSFLRNRIFKKKKTKKKRKKKSKNIIAASIDRYDWASHWLDRYDWATHNRFDSIKEEKPSRNSDTQSTNDAKTNRKRGKKAKKKKTKKRRNRKKDSSSQNKTRKKAKNKKKRRKKESKHQEETAKTSLETRSVPQSIGKSHTYSSGSPGLQRSIAQDDRAGTKPRSSPEITQYPQNDPFDLALTPKRRNNNSASKNEMMPTAIMVPALQISDLRSPIAWETRRQELLKKSGHESGSVAISAISLDDPLLSHSGYFLTNGNPGILEKLLTGGAFVYKASEKERKMRQLHRRLMKTKSSMDSSSSGGTPTINSGSIEVEHPDSPAVVVLPPPSIESSRQASILTEKMGDWYQEESDRVNLPLRLNTLSHIHELEMMDQDSSSSDNSSSLGVAVEFDNSDNYSQSRFQTSSCGSARVTGEHDLWSYSTGDDDDEKSSSWLRRLRDRWIRRARRQ